MWSPAIELVSLDQAKASLKLPLDITAEDDDLQLRLEIAHSIVFSYLVNRLEDQDEWEQEMEEWTDTSAPPEVKGAILFLFGKLYRSRGDDDDRMESSMLPGWVRAQLDRLRDPTIT